MSTIQYTAAADYYKWETTEYEWWAFRAYYDTKWEVFCRDMYGKIEYYKVGVARQNEKFSTTLVESITKQVMKAKEEKQ